MLTSQPNTGSVKKRESRTVQPVPQKPQMKYAILLAAIIILSIIASTAFYYGPSPIDGSDSYINAYLAYSFYAHGSSGIVNGGPMAVKLVLVGGTALFYKLFGISRLSSIALYVACVQATIVVLYLIGKELCDRNAGIIASLLYGISPVAVLESSNMGSMSALALFVSLAVFLMLKSFGSNDKSQLYLALSSFVAMVGILTDALEVLIFVFIIPAVIINIVKKKEHRIESVAVFIIGMIAGILVLMLLGFAQSGSVTYIYNQYASWYSGGGAPCPSCALTISTYASFLMPFRVVSALSGYLKSVSPIQLTVSLIRAFTNPRYFFAWGYPPYYFGFYFYAALLVSIYLLFKNPKRLYIPWLWIITMLLYLSFGTQSLKSYTRISIGYPERSLLILWPAVALLIGLGLSSFLHTNRKSRLLLVMRYVIASALLVFLAYTSLNSIMYFNYSMSQFTYPMVMTGEFVNSLPANSIIYHPVGLPIIQYTDAEQNFTLSSNPFNCDVLTANSFLVIYANTSIETKCNLSIAYVPPAIPSSLSPYTFFALSSGWDFSNVTVYVRKNDSGTSTR